MPIESPLFARYPYIDAARAAAEGADVSIHDAAREPAVVDRAVERIERAIEAGDVGTEHLDHRVEFLSYPVARVLVSMVDAPGLADRYALAEAETAAERLAADARAAGMASIDRDTMSAERLLRELGVDGAEPADDGYRMEVTDYLSLSAGLDDGRWRLVRRQLADGYVPITVAEFDRLVSAAVRARVADGLPVKVPRLLAERLSDTASDIRDRLAEHGGGWRFDAPPRPELAPPCMRAIAASASAGHRGRFVLSSFRDAIGDGAVYPPPSCAAMDECGLCVNKDDLCERIDHPLDYYRRRLKSDG